MRQKSGYHAVILRSTVQPGTTEKIVQPLLDDPPPVVPYEVGSWGPEEADRLVKGICDWDEPWRPTEDPRHHMLLGG